MPEHSDVYRKLARDIVTTFEKEMGKFDFNDFRLVAGIICKELFPAEADACSWNYDKLSPEEKADYDFMMHM